MTDKYASLRPPKPRSCHRGDGVPKVRMTRRRAVATAAQYEGYHHYRCPECGAWHVGRERVA